MFRSRLEDVTFRLTKVHRSSPTLEERPPEGAIVLFDGSSAEEWQDGQIIYDHLLDVGTTSKRDFGSVLIHLEMFIKSEMYNTTKWQNGAGETKQLEKKIKILSVQNRL